MNFMDMLKINLTNATPGDTLVYNGFSWNPASNGTISVNGKSGKIDLTTSDIPEGNSFYFTPERVESVVKKIDLDALQNVVISNPATNDVLTYIDSTWVNKPFQLSRQTVESALGYIPAPLTSPIFDQIHAGQVNASLVSTNLLQVTNSGLVKNLNVEQLNSKPASYYAEQAMVLICSDELSALDIGEYKIKMPFASKLTKLKVYFTSISAQVDLQIQLDGKEVSVSVSDLMNVIYLDDSIAEDGDISVKVVNPGTNTVGMKLNLYYHKL